MILPNLELEKGAWLFDKLVCGIDEVGRGSLAGPVVAAAVIFPKNHVPIIGIRDSKKISAKKRELLFDQIIEASLDFGVGLISSSEIDRDGIVLATKKAMVSALRWLSVTPDLIVIDAVSLNEIEIEQKAIPKADENCYSVASASIIAKVFRDRVISGLDNAYEGYNFSTHKGYGTKTHYEAINANGLTPEHRRTFLRSNSRRSD